MADTQFNNVNKYKEYSPIFIRLIIGFHLIYGVVDNIVSWSRMKEFETFLKDYHFPIPLVCAIASVYLQCLCGICYILGFKTRMAALLMIINFLVALSVHTNDGYQDMFPALMMLSASLFLFVNGAGKPAIDNLKRFN